MGQKQPILFLLERRELLTEIIVISAKNYDAIRNCYVTNIG